MVNLKLHCVLISWWSLSYCTDSWTAVHCLIDRDPVVRMALALYGRVDAGGYWEEYCAKNVLTYGFNQVEGWDSTCWHFAKQALLVVYVDDFLIVAPRGPMKTNLMGKFKGNTY